MQELESSLLDLLRPRFSELAFSTIELLEQAATLAPTAAALLEPDRASLSYGQLLALARATVAALNSLGFTPSSRIAVVLPPSTAATCVHLCVVAGAAVMPLSDQATEYEYCRAFTQGRVDAVLLPQSQLAAPREAAAQLGIAVIEIAFAAGGSVGDFAIVGAPEPQSAAAPQFAQPDDLAVLFFTSGTTDTAKLLPFSQRLVAKRVYFRPTVEDDPVWLNMLPPYHAIGWLSGIRNVAYRRSCTTPLLNDTAAIYHSLALYGPTAITISPALLQKLIDDAPDHAAEIARIELKEITAVGAALSPALYHAAQQVFRAAVGVYYASSESGRICGKLQRSGDPSYKIGMLGQPFSFVRVRIIDQEGAPLPPGATGEITVCSPLMISGYDNNPAATAAAFRDGFFRTGDEGYLDEAGNLFLTGRIKEMINRGGSKISPLEVDLALAQHPAVAEVAVFGFPHATLGEDLAAAIVLRQPGTTERELRSFAARSLSFYKVPSRFVFVDDLPKTDTGKVKRAALTAQFQALLER